MVSIVTGCSGFIGSHLVDRLIELGEKVKGIDIKNPHRDDFEFQKIDIQDYNSIYKALKGAKIVYHLAALASHRLSLGKCSSFTRTNEIGTRNILEVCRKIGTDKVVFTSSSSIYGKPSDRELPLTEESPLRPLGPYAISKVAAKIIVTFIMRFTKCPL